MQAQQVTPESTRVGWIGTGVMGRYMCEHVLDAGYQVAVYNRSSHKADFLTARGASRAASPEEVASKSDVVFTIVGFPADVREVYLGRGKHD